MNASNIVERGRARLLFLDGLRGLAAFYITLYHAHSQIDWDLHPTPFSPMASFVSTMLNYGHYAVAIFIVLSGYCLMLPVARGRGLHMPGGVGRYFLRRARRILPPYYAALAGSLGLIAAIPALRHPVSGFWLSALPAFAYGPIVSHLFLVHSFSSQWTLKINPPMWSVGIEWWIYFLFPAILLPIWRRFGMYGSLGVATALGVGVHFIPKHGADFFFPWYFTLFAFGAAAAYVNFSPVARWEQNWNWSLMAVASSAVAILLLAVAPGWSAARQYFSDSVVGVSVSIFLVWCGKQASQAMPMHFVVRFLESRILLGLGTISYSLYLVHFPLISLIHEGLRSAKLSADAQMLTMIFVGGSFSLAAACVFYQLCEKPFLYGHPRSPVKAALAVSAEPAP